MGFVTSASKIRDTLMPFAAAIAYSSAEVV